MTGLRRHILLQRWLAAWLLAFVLLMKVAVPGGFMLGVNGGPLVLQLCPSQAPQLTTAPMPGMTHHAPPKQEHKSASDTPCVFSGLAAPALGPVDPLLLPTALIVIVALAMRPNIAVGTRASRHIRPPLRGPPATA